MSAWSQFPSLVPSGCFLSDLLTLTSGPACAPPTLGKVDFCFGVRDVKQSSCVVVSWVWILTGSPHGDGLLRGSLTRGPLTHNYFQKLQPHFAMAVP